MSVRKAHNSGRNHERNVLDYYQRTALPQLPPDVRPLLSEGCSNGRSVEIGHEKAQSVIDSITSSYAAEGQAGSNPMLNQGGGPMGGPGFPPPFGFPGRISIPFSEYFLQSGSNQAQRHLSKVLHEEWRLPSELQAAFLRHLECLEPPLPEVQVVFLLVRFLQSLSVFTLRLSDAILQLLSLVVAFLSHLFHPT